MRRSGCLPGSALTPRLIEGIVRLGSALPFEQAPALLSFFTGVRVSAETVRRLTETAGTVQLARETAAVVRLEQELPEPPVGPGLQQLSADGAMLPLVGGVWAEVKTLAIGMVESANKLLVEARLKGSGMHWLRSNVNALLALRCLERNGRWDAEWPALWHAWRRQRREQRRQRRAMRRAASQPALASVPAPARTPRHQLMVNGKPTADHP